MTLTTTTITTAYPSASRPESARAGPDKGNETGRLSGRTGRIEPQSTRHEWDAASFRASRSAGQTIPGTASEPDTAGLGVATIESGPRRESATHTQTSRDALLQPMRTDSPVRKPFQPSQGTYYDTLLLTLMPEDRRHEKRRYDYAEQRTEMQVIAERTRAPTCIPYKRFASFSQSETVLLEQTYTVFWPSRGQMYVGENTQDEFTELTSRFESRGMEMTRCHWGAEASMPVLCSKRFHDGEFYLEVKLGSSATK